MADSPVPDGETYPAAYFERQDPTDDARFYDFPRKVVHIDDGAIAALGQAYAELLPRSGLLLDLMSSWRSHLPPELEGAPGLEVVGLGMNAEEMADNPALERFVVHDLNREPRLPFQAGVFDGAMCAVSVQYLTRPIEVFAEVARVLRPGAPFLISFSNRCFPTKAVAVWLAGDDQQHLALVGSYFQLAGGWTDLQARGFTQPAGDPLFVVWARRA
jgi:SAM-dependent methyltransferase